MSELIYGLWGAVSAKNSDRTEVGSLLTPTRALHFQTQKYLYDESCLPFYVALSSTDLFTSTNPLFGVREQPTQYAF